LRGEGGRKEKGLPKKERCVRKEKAPGWWVCLHSRGRKTCEAVEKLCFSKKKIKSWPGDNHHLGVRTTGGSINGGGYK